MNKPKIRFKGFQGEWKEVKLSSIAIFSKGQGYSKSDLRENGHPIILYGRMYTKYQFAINEVDTFSNLKGAYVLSEGNEIIMPASGETSEDIACASAVLAKGIILGGDLNIVRFDLKKYSTPFLALTITYSKTHYDLSKCAQGKSVVHLHNEAISKTAVFIPSLPEQRALASYFTSLDAQIAASTSRLSSLKQIKAASLLNMFPQKGEMVPRVRFKGFQGEWDSPSIEDVFEIRNGYTPSKSVESYWIGGTIPWFRMEDIRASGGFLEDSIQHITPKAVKNNGLFEKDSIIMATTATIGVHAQLIADSLANQQFTNFSIRKSLREGIIAKYVYYAFFGIDEWAIKNTNSGGLLSVNMPLLLKQPFFVPSLPEQRAIASYFTALDAQITLHRERLEKLKQIKAACLEKMFA